METVVLAGGSGFLGRSLARRLPGWGYEPVILTRSPRSDSLFREVAWDGRSIGQWAEALEGAAAVVNLSGKSVDCRYTAANRREILESRVRSVEVLGEAVRRCARPPRAFVQAGSLAIYGDTKALCDEGAPPGKGFSAEVCLAWEKAWGEMQLPAGARSVLLRIGFALGRDGGALEPLARLARWGLGGTVGCGGQMVSWLHIDDLRGMFRWAIERPGIEGIYNATGPSPVTNRALMRSLRKALGRPWSPPTPSCMVRLGARLLRTEPELALSGRRCVPRRFLEAGFRFDYPDLDWALRSLLVR